MKQETSKKSKKWIWLVAGAVLLLAIVGVVLALVLGGQGNTGDRADLYWNVDRKTFLEGSDSGLSTREPAEDGLFHVRFAYNGEQVEYTVEDKRLINFIDTMDVMGLVFDDNGMIIDAVDPVDLVTEVGVPLYVQNVEGNKIVANTSPTMNALSMDLMVTEKTQIYDVTAKAEVVGALCEPSDILQTDHIYVYANEAEEITHIYIVKHAVKSPVYWRAQQFYTSSKKETSRVPDENGVYTIDFFCDGEPVTLQCKKKDVVSAIDSRSVYSAHVGLVFDDDGFIDDTVGSAEGIGGLLLCERYWITSFNGNTYTAEKLGSNSPAYNFAVPSTCKIYDVSKAAMSENRQGKPVDYITEGDRVCVWTDTNGVPVLIYVANHVVDVPVYFNPDRQYDAKKGTTREPDSQGYYNFELYETGATGLSNYKTNDKALADYLDSIPSRIVGLIIEDGIIQRVYDPEAVFGNTHYTYGRYVDNITGPLISCILVGQPLNANSAALSTQCEVYNASGYGEYGLTTLQVGDCIYAMRDPTGEVIRIYILRRVIGEYSLYFNLDPQYDAETKTSKRKPDEDGWYRIPMAHNGQQVTLRTSSKYMVDKVEGIDSVGAAALIVSGDVIIDAFPPQWATGGSKVSSGYRIESFNEDGTITTYYKTRKNTFRLSDDCVYYNVSNHIYSHKGEHTYHLQYGDMLTVFTNYKGEAEVIYVRNRVADKVGWKTEQMYDSTNKVTTRVPDADGWYYVDIACDGEVKTYKTKSKELMSIIDSYGSAFGFSTDGDVLCGFAAMSWVRGLGGNGVTSYDIVAIDGNYVTVKYNVPGSSATGTTKKIYVPSSAKIYDVSPTAESFGAPVKLQVGDRIRTYVDTSKTSHVYAYVLYHDTRVGGSEGYCEHCQQVVYWNPWAGEALAKNGAHYYLNTDCEAKAQTSIGSESKDYEIVLDLNGKTINYTNISPTLVRYNETFTIMDCVGGGVMSSTGVNGALGGMFLASNCTINLYGGTLTRSAVDNTISYGGLFRMSSGAVLNVYGGEISGGVVAPLNASGVSYGGNIYAQSKSVINLYGGKIGGGIANAGQFTTVNAETGEETTKNIDGLGGNIYMSSSELNVYGGELTGGNATHGGNVYATGSTINLHGGVVADGVATNGGNIYVAGSAKLYTFGDALITRGVSTRGVSRNNGGGNVFVQKGAEVVMSGGSVTDGTAVSYGGNIACRGGKFVINDGVVSGGVSETGYGHNVFINGFSGTGEKPESDAMMVAAGGQIVNGDVYLYEPDSASEMRMGLTGAPVIEQLRVDAGALIELYEMTDGADVAVMASNCFTLPYEHAEAYVNAGYIKPHAEAEGSIKVIDNALWMVYQQYCAHCNELVEWTKWKVQNGGEATAIRESGHYYLTDDVLGITSQIRIGVQDQAQPDVVIDLNGHTMKSGKRVFAIYPGSTLSIIDSVGGGEIQGRMIDANQHGGVIRVDVGSTLNLYGGAITDIATEAHAAYGGAISTEGGTINIIGGTVSGGTSKYGGTIYVAKSNAASGSVPGTLNISGGVINGGTAAHEVDAPAGGAIFLSNSNFIMTGGTVTGGKSTSEAKLPIGGNIYFTGSDSLTFEITGGTIENGEAVNGNGGNIYVNTGSLTIGGDAKIAGGISGRGSSRNNGGGNIYMQVSTTLNLNGGEITGGVSEQSYGGNVFTRGNFNMTDGVIANGTATNGGNVFVNGYDRERIFTMTGGTIKDGTATTGAIDRVAMVKPAYDGDNVYVNSAIIDISGGTITDNDGGNAILAYTSKADFPAKVILSVADNADLAAALDGKVYLISGAQIFADMGGTKADADGDKIWCIEGYDVEAPTEPTTVPTEPSTEPTEPSTAPTEPTDAPVTPAGKCPHCGVEMSELTWTAWTATNGGESSTVLADAHYYLTGDVLSVTAQIRIGKENEATPDVVIDLRGHTIKAGKRAFAVYPGSSLSIMDTVGGGAVKGGMIDASQHGGVIRVDVGSTLNLFSGRITDIATEAHAAYGGAIATEGGTINIAGGIVSGGTAKYGGTIYVTKSNAASGSVPGTLNISDGTVVGGTAAHEVDNPCGGAIFVNNGNFIMTGGKVSGGVATSTAKTPAGGAVYLSGTTGTHTFMITGGTIENGSALNGNGGNLYLANGTLTIGGDAKIVGGTATRAVSRNNGGGNIYLQVSTVLNIEGGEITGGVCENSYGGNVFCRGTLTMTDGVISDGAAINGGNVFVNGYDRERIFTMTGGTIKNGTATTGAIDRTAMVKPAYDGDNVYINSAIMNLTGGMITDDDGGNAILAYTVKADYPATINMQLADKAELADALDGKVYLVANAVLNADIGGTTTDADGDMVWFKVAPETEPTEPSTEATTAPTEPGTEATTAPTEPGTEATTAPTEPSTEATTAPTEPSAEETTAPSEPEAKCPHCGVAIAELSWNEWTPVSGGSITEDGHYYLSADFSDIKSQLKIGASDGSVPANVVIDLKGFDLAAPSRRAFAVYPGSTLSILDTVGGGEITGAYVDANQNGGVIRVDLNATFNLYGGTITDTATTAHQGYGGAISTQGGTIRIAGGTVNGGTSPYGGTIYVAKASNVAGNLIVEGGVINGGTAANEAAIPAGGAIYVNSGNFIMTGGKISGGTATSTAKTPAGGAVYLSGTTGTHTFAITGGTIENGSALNGNGGNIYLNGGTLTIGGDAKIVGGTANRGSSRNNGGGNIYVYVSGVLNIEGGEITGGIAENSYGGNVFSRGNVTLTDGVISDGTATNGGNVFINGYDRERIFTMTGGTIKNGTATTGAIDRVTMVKPAYDGDNVYVNSAIMNITGGMITDDDGGNAILAYTVKADYPATINMQLAENAELADALDGKVYLIANAVLNADIGGTTTDADGDMVWFKVAPETEPTEPSTEATTAPTEPSTEATTAPTEPSTEATTAPTEPSTEATTAPTEPSTEATTAPTEPSTEATTAPTEPEEKCPHCGVAMSEIEWVDWAGAQCKTSDHNGVHYRLTGDIAPAGQIYIGQNDNANTADVDETTKNDVVIDLNGHKIEAKGRAFTPYAGSTLTLINTSETEALITGGYTNSPGGVINLSTHATNGGCTLNLYGNIRIRSTAASSATHGRVIALDGGTFNMYGGAIVGSETSRDGGAVYLKNADFYMAAGEITGGIAGGGEGGAVYVEGGSFTMAGGTINGGTATNGGAVYAKNVVFTMTGGTISGGEATNGGAVYLYTSDFEMTGGTITGGTATHATETPKGGNIYMYQTSAKNVSISGTAKITDGTAENGNGGNIYVDNAGVLVISGDAEISGGTATRAISRNNGGGNIYMMPSTTLKINGGTIKDGTATQSYGGNVFARCNVEMTAGTITNGTAINGGNVFVNGYNAVKTFTFSGGTISNGTASTGKIDLTAMVKESYNGDNVYINSAIMNITGGMITDDNGGNAILVFTPAANYPATINLTVSGNTELATALSGKVYLVASETPSVLNADLGTTNTDADGDVIWYASEPVESVMRAVNAAVAGGVMTKLNIG